MFASFLLVFCPVLKFLKGLYHSDPFVSTHVADTIDEMVSVELSDFVLVVLSRMRKDALCGHVSVRLLVWAPVPVDMFFEERGTR
jgi:hypothetical protein